MDLDQRFPAGMLSSNKGCAMTEEEQIEIEDDGAEMPPESKGSVETPETGVSTVDSERLKAENEAYQRHYDALREEISEIRKKFHVEGVTAEADDPIKRFSGELEELRGGFAELKELIRNVQQPVQQQPQYQQQYQQPWQQYSPQQMVSPIFQPSPIFGAAPLPYIQTPTFAPQIIMPPMPGANNNYNAGR